MLKHAGSIETHFHLAYEHLVGLHVCAFSPEYNNREQKDLMPCQDLFGSNATPEGGCFGRADGCITSIESQKSTGALHGHSQLHVQCLHQHTPLRDIFHQITKGNTTIVQDYLRYKSHVCRKEYADPTEWKKRQCQREDDWPEYTKSLELVSVPSF